MFKKRVFAWILTAFLMTSVVNTSVLPQSREPAAAHAEQSNNPWQEKWMDFCEWIARSLHLLEEDL